MFPSLPRSHTAAFSPGVARNAASVSGQPGIVQYRVLELWHLLSLDAPTVAVVWLLFIALASGQNPGVATPTALFLAVWILYAADRLLDAQSLTKPAAAAWARTTLSELPELEFRHHFHHRHRSRFLLVLVLATTLLAFTLAHLPVPIFEAESLLALLLLPWLLTIHRLSSRRPLPKEFPVGNFFAAAVSLPALVRSPSLLPALLPGAALFAGVCTLNCLLLFAWEHPHDRTCAHPATCWAVNRLPALALGLLLLATATAILFPLFSSSGLRAVPLACALSTALLVGLHSVRGHVEALRLRALADLVLLTPLLFALRTLWH